VAIPRKDDGVAQTIVTSVLHKNCEIQLTCARKLASRHLQTGFALVLKERRPDSTKLLTNLQERIESARSVVVQAVIPAMVLRD
jgi:hypothetical protein